MSHDALFQLGMGPVQLDATQTEDLFTTRALKACAEACDRLLPVLPLPGTVAFPLPAIIKRRVVAREALLSVFAAVRMPKA